jgi:hypothetical protein
MTIEEMAKALGLPIDAIRRHVASGAPTSADGRMNLVHYAAWLNTRLGETGQSE